MQYAGLKEVGVFTLVNIVYVFELLLPIYT